MLILTRKMGQSVIVGDDVVVRVLGVNREQVRLGIDAPKHVSVHREEVYKRIIDGAEDQKKQLVNASPYKPDWM